MLISCLILLNYQYYFSVLSFQFPYFREHCRIIWRINVLRKPVVYLTKLTWIYTTVLFWRTKKYHIETKLCNLFVQITVQRFFIRSSVENVSAAIICKFCRRQRAATLPPDILHLRPIIFISGSVASALPESFRAIIMSFIITFFADIIFFGK